MLYFLLVFFLLIWTLRSAEWEVCSAGNLAKKYAALIFWPKNVKDVFLKILSGWCTLSINASQIHRTRVDNIALRNALQNPSKWFRFLCKSTKNPFFVASLQTYCQFFSEVSACLFRWVTCTSVLWVYFNCFLKHVCSRDQSINLLHGRQISFWYCSLSVFQLLLYRSILVLQNTH